MIMDEALVKLQEDHGVDKSAIQECLANVPVLEGMLLAVKEAAQAGAQVYIVSDANEFFIKAFLEKEQLSDLVTHVTTNLSYTSGPNEHLRVKPYHQGPKPHGCELCPPNLCKGLVLQDHIQVLKPNKRVVYVGDGSGDFCPATRLRHDDILLVREDPTYTSALGLSKRIEKKKETYPLAAKVVKWQTGTQVLETIRQALAT
eukprot:CAMPEP_0184558580 /NCGR_PEP_ID=MMETSP0199_2-20130426/45837_1 /TAXON_ID=1112570 /ORGANISM="Thraustochytrium sp., Strain LLF1b" /LENGTH=201 /DNA_ID=CAMNT_0026955819 /DNA_START=68 /DNA_END=669 /DNA_ORIENTATION=+